jgi:hypothetical protein
MGLRKDVPSTSKPAHCAFLVDGEKEKCGKDAHIIVEGVVEIMGKEINIKKLICEEHAGIVKNRT